MQVRKIEGMGFDSNIYVLKDGGRAAIVDTGTGFNSAYVINGIMEKVDMESVDAIQCDAEVMIHEKGAETIEKGLDRSSSLFGVEQPAIKVDRKLNEGDIVKVGEAKLKVIYTPGHSPGSICLYEAESKSLFSGDTIFSDGGVGRTDFWGGDIEELVNSIRRIGEFDIVNLYPGHGPHIEGNGAKHVSMYARAIDVIWMRKSLYLIPQYALSGRNRFKIPFQSKACRCRRRIPQRGKNRAYRAEKHSGVGI